MKRNHRGLEHCGCAHVTRDPHLSHQTKVCTDKCLFEHTTGFGHQSDVFLRFTQGCRSQCNQALIAIPMPKNEAETRLTPPRLSPSPTQR